jgi:hypothetical protein
MNQDQVVNTAILSMQKVNDNTFNTDQLAVIGSYFYMLYAVGYDEGRKQLSHRRPVIVYKHGVIICEKDSVSDAARYAGITYTSVSNAIKKGNVTRKGNFTFKYK